LTVSLPFLNNSLGFSLSLKIAWTVFKVSI
jgi:hypothetical protein